MHCCLEPRLSSANVRISQVRHVCKLGFNLLSRKGGGARLLGRRSECGGTSGKSGDNGELYFDNKVIIV